MRRLAMIALAAIVAAPTVLAACSSKTNASTDAAIDAAPDAPPKAVPCSPESGFGSGVTAGFGRIDGTVLAIVPPNDQDCAEPNSTHLVIQVSIADGAYRMVVDVLSTSGSPEVLIDELDTALVGPAWSEGWHQPVAVDFPTTFGVHSTSFTAMEQADLVTKITNEISLGSHISIYGTATTSEPHSPHLVHRYPDVPSSDGAIVIDPDTAPHFILLNFDEYTF
jgi:hypothetical protein